MFCGLGNEIEGSERGHRRLDGEPNMISDRGVDLFGGSDFTMLAEQTSSKAGVFGSKVWNSPWTC
jgi:hypothetical protein